MGREKRVFPAFSWNCLSIRLRAASDERSIGAISNLNRTSIRVYNRKFVKRKTCFGRWLCALKNVLRQIARDLLEFTPG